MNRVEVQTGLMPLTMGDIKFDINGVTEALNALAGGFNVGSPYIIYGCSLTQNGADVNLSAGAIYRDGEVFIVDAFTFPNLTVAEVSIYYFDLDAQWDSAGLKEFFDNSVKNTRRIRKAIVTPAPETFTADVTIGQSIRIDNNVTVVASNLATHEAIGNNHNYLANHVNSGNSTSFTGINVVVSLGSATIDEADGDYWANLYLVGNIVHFDFVLPITITGGANNSLLLQMPSWWGNGSGHCEVYVSSGMVEGYKPVTPLLFECTASQRFFNISARNIDVRTKDGSNFTQDSKMYFTGTLIIKKSSTGTGLPA